MIYARGGILGCLLIFDGSMRNGLLPTINIDKIIIFPMDYGRFISMALIF